LVLSSGYSITLGLTHESYPDESVRRSY
jgi:hypothetical protein